MSYGWNTDPTVKKKTKWAMILSIYTAAFVAAVMLNVKIVGERSQGHFQEICIKFLAIRHFFLYPLGDKSPVENTGPKPLSELMFPVLPFIYLMSPGLVLFEKLQK